jgi:hypothetical protein
MSGPPRGWVSGYRTYQEDGRFRDATRIHPLPRGDTDLTLRLNHCVLAGKSTTVKAMRKPPTDSQGNASCCVGVNPGDCIGEVGMQVHRPGQRKTGAASEANKVGSHRTIMDVMEMREIAVQGEVKSPIRFLPGSGKSQ